MMVAMTVGSWTARTWGWGGGGGWMFSGWVWGENVFMAVVVDFLG